MEPQQTKYRFPVDNSRRKFLISSTFRPYLRIQGVTRSASNICTSPLRPDAKINIPRLLTLCAADNFDIKGSDPSAPAHLISRLKKIRYLSTALRPLAFSNFGHLWTMAQEFPRTNKEMARASECF